MNEYFLTFWNKYSGITYITLTGNKQEIDDYINSYVIDGIIELLECEKIK